MAELPEDLLMGDILPRLPVKSIGRFRCVSKLWRCWLSSPQLVKAHIHHSPETIIIESLFLQSYLYISTLATKSCVNGGSNFAMKKVTSPLIRPNDVVECLGSCHGLVLLSHCNTKILMNPMTLEAEKVMDFPKHTDQRAFGYDSLNDDYKIVTLTYEESSNSDCFVDIYSVRTKTWKRVVCDLAGYSLRCYCFGVFVNGCIHWLAYKPGNAIASLSLASEEFDILQPPSVFDGDEFYFGSLMNLGGCLTLVLYKHDSVDIWMMREYGVQGSWVKLSVSIPRHQDFNERSIQVLCHVGVDDILLVRYFKQLMVYNLRSGDWKEVGVDGIPETRVRSFWTFTPTLVSPTRCNWSETHKNT